VRGRVVGRQKAVAGNDGSVVYIPVPSPTDEEGIRYGLRLGLRVSRFVGKNEGSSVNQSRYSYVLSPL